MTIYTDSKEDIKSKKGSQIHESNSTKKVWRIVDTTTNSLTRLSNQQRLIYGLWYQRVWHNTHAYSLIASLDQRSHTCESTNYRRQRPILNRQESITKIIIPQFKGGQTQWNQPSNSKTLNKTLLITTSKLRNTYFWVWWKKQRSSSVFELQFQKRLIGLSFLLKENSKIF
jgi:hypothetical protein